MRISQASAVDLTSLVQLVNSAYRGPESLKGWTSEATLLDGQRTDADQLQALIAMPGTCLLLAKEGDELLGSVLLQRETDAYYLGMLTVRPALQGGGIGKKLMLAAEAFVTEQGGSRIVMTVISARTELIAWYARRGYQDTGVRKPFPTDPAFGIPRQPIEFIVMHKNLVAR